MMTVGIPIDGYALNIAKAVRKARRIAMRKRVWWVLTGGVGVRYAHVQLYDDSDESGILRARLWRNRKEILLRAILANPEPDVRVVVLSAAPF